MQIVRQMVHVSGMPMTDPFVVDVPDDCVRIGPVDFVSDWMGCGAAASVWDGHDWVSCSGPDSSDVDSRCPRCDFMHDQSD